MSSRKKFHVTRDGSVRPCMASKRPCPYPAEDHARTVAEAEKRRDEMLRSRYGSGLNGMVTARDGSPSFSSAPGRTVDAKALDSRTLRDVQLHGKTVSTGHVKEFSVVGLSAQGSDLDRVSFLDSHASVFDVTDSTLNGCRMRSTDLHGGKIRSTGVYDTEFFEGELKNIRAIRCSFVGSSFILSGLHSGVFRGSDLKNVTTTGSTVSKTMFVSCGFQGYSSSDDVFRETRFDGNVFEGDTSFLKTTFERCSFNDNDLSGAKSPDGGAVFSGCVFDGCSFKGTDLSGVVFDGGTVFRNCVFDSEDHMPRSGCRIL